MAASAQLHNIAGLVFIDSPLIPEAWTTLSAKYKALTGPDYKVVKQAFNEHPSADTFKAQMLASSIMFFTKKNMEQGKRLLQNDRMSWKSMKLLGPVSEEELDFPAFIKNLPVPKITVAGIEDPMLPPDFLKKQSDLIDSKFYIIEHAGHFPTLDDPESVARIIDNSF